MKKTLLITSLMSLILTCTTTLASDTAQPQKAIQPQPQKHEFRNPMPPKFDKQKQEEFQNKLGLTEEQKAQAKQIHENGIEQMKPVMEKIKAKHQAIKAIKDDQNLTEEQKTTQIEQQVKELKALKRYSHELRMKNMKEFEEILTKDQKKTLDKMKEEGRKNFDREFRKNHKKQGFGFGPGYGGGFEHRPMPIKPTPEEK